MALIKYNPRTTSVFPSVASLLDDFFGDISSVAGTDAAYSKPAVNIKENNEGYQLDFAVPGLNKELFKVSLDGDELTVSAELNQESGEEAGKYNRREFSHGSFTRVFTLPDTADAEHITAKYENGILRVHVPKKAEVKKEAKQIKIS